ncbi:MAG: helix-turn-helix domain-containing protein, partial [Gammaproteobacteria bacterium]|nr:helix-turn-helix domain-containing protein [Gammaproteobacteria bacterium]
MLCKKILAFWQVTTDSDCSSTIVPDGCRDLIMHQPAGQATTWFVSPLFDKLSILELAANSRLYGFRLQPGASIDEVKLLASLPLTPLAPLDIQDRIDCYCTYDKNIAQALSCLATETASVPIAAKLLGVSMRTLQRHIFKTTQRTPAYWLQLARVRKAARALNSSLELIEIAETFG